MRSLFLLFSFFILFGACKASKKNNSSLPPITTEEIAGKFKGKVSHEYKKTGCATVVIVEQQNQPPLILIPKDPLPAQFDKDGLQINFNYRVLKMKNPAGCEKGIPAVISDVTLGK